MNEAVTKETTEDELSRTVTMNARGDNDDLEAGASMTMTGETIKEEGGVKRRRKEAEDHREKKLDTESGNTTKAKSGRVKEALEVGLEGEDDGRRMGELDQR